MARPLSEILEDPQVYQDLENNPHSFRFKEGAVVMVSTVHRPPHVELLKDHHGRLTITGPLANLMDAVAHSLNFTYKIVTPPDGTYGAHSANGSWSGMMGQVVRKEADVSLGPFAISWKRNQAVDFAHHYLFDYGSMIKSKGLPEIDPWGFLFPLQPKVWAALLAGLLVAWLAILVLGHNPDGSRKVNRASDLFFQHLKVIFYQNLTIKVKRGSEMVLLGGWVVVAMMVMWSYTGNLVSLLAVRHIPQPLQTLRDVIEESNLKVIVEPKTILTDHLDSAKSGDLRDIGDLVNVGRIKYEVTSDLLHVVDTLVRDGDHTLATIKISLIKFISELSRKTGKHSRCDFYIVRETLNHVSQCMVGQKGNPIVPAMSHRISALVESGLYEYWLMNNIPFIENCRHSPSKITVMEPLALTNLWGMFVLLVGGNLLALLTFSLELCITRKAGVKAS
ncbi:Glutamate receptor ionotropic, delta-2-like 5 [Homarus americanus]|uniref:Glutamate receptor ionotropic, delta-2-like 5 n=1 Tax=Homarus americanus TaxID=6706 RepID=A0A8J5JLK0_HOMAM|nr:Glutamate receptor ionotropic, delta-2-like 5 [Homarus americanus]